MRKNAKKRKRTSKLKQFHLSSLSAHTFRKSNNIEYPPINAPKDFRLVDNTLECANFFRKLRSVGNVSVENYKQYKTVSLLDVETIDFAAVHTLTAICKELRCNNISVYGNLPNNTICRKYMVDSGFLDNKYNNQGKLFQLSSQTETMSFEMGQGSRLQSKHIINLLNISTKISSHLSSEANDYPRRLMSILKEICGNSIEWAESYRKQWFFAARFDDNTVTVAVIDLGQGILQSLERKFFELLKDFISRKSHLQILNGAFNEKYGSKSKEVNRNKGLPSIKFANDSIYIKDLTVITNNVILSFGNPNKSATFATSLDAFKGTIYCFNIDASCLAA